MWNPIKLRLSDRKLETRSYRGQPPRRRSFDMYLLSRLQTHRGLTSMLIKRYEGHPSWNRLRTHRPNMRNTRNPKSLWKTGNPSNMTIFWRNASRLGAVAALLFSVTRKLKGAIEAGSRKLQAHKRMRRGKIVLDGMLEEMEI